MCWLPLSLAAVSVLSYVAELDFFLFFFNVLQY